MGQGQGLRCVCVGGCVVGFSAPPREPRKVPFAAVVRPGAVLAAAAGAREGPVPPREGPSAG